MNSSGAPPVNPTGDVIGSCFGNGDWEDDEAVGTTPTAAVVPAGVELEFKRP